MKELIEKYPLTEKEESIKSEERTNKDGKTTKSKKDGLQDCLEDDQIKMSDINKASKKSIEVEEKKIVH